MMRRTVLRVLIGGLAPLAPALLAPPAGASELEAVLAKGVSTYRTFCSHCHGVDMVSAGTGSYDLRRFPLDQRARFESSVMDGRGDMPAWGDILKPDELESLWVYVATRGGKEPYPDAPEAAPPADDAETDDSAAAPPAPSDLDPVAEGRLTVCLARNGGALSGWRHEGGSGFDYRVAAATAEAMGLDLAVQWFESEPEEESDPVKETYALLAKGLCDLVPAVALYEGALGPPPAENAAPPRWDDMPTRDWVEFVPLEPVAATRPYMRAEIGIVTGPKVGRAIEGPKDLAGLDLGVQQGTLSGIIALTEAPQATVDASVTFNPGPDFLWKLEGGAFDAALVDVAAFDFHRRQNPVSLLTLHDWRHPLGFNIAMAGLERNPNLIAAADAALADLAASGVLEELAEAEDIHYAAPREPWMQRRLTRRDLRRAP
ncbi:MAG: transporter substrate-binding domain-containing protein [Paracoccaceae bacterium]